MLRLSKHERSLFQHAANRHGAPQSMTWPAPVTLRGVHATLVPLAPEHEAALADAVRDGELWKLWSTVVPAPEGMAAEITRRLALRAAGSMLPFTVPRECTGTNPREGQVASHSHVV